MLKQTLTALITLLASAIALPAASYYTVRLDDPKAVYLTRGAGDDSDAIQQAIDKVQETTGEGVVFVPEGRYRLTKTVYVWPAIRLIGYGTERPVFVLGENTPGYQDPGNENYMVFFSGGRGRQGGRGGASGRTRRRHGGRGGATAGRPGDASPGTFYSALPTSTSRFEDGNPGAVAVRARYAQHCFLAHMDFRLGSALAGIHEAGNVIEDVHFYGGHYGIWTSDALTGVAVHGDGLSLRRAARSRHPGTRSRTHAHPPPFSRRAPPPSRSNPEADELWVKDARLEEVSGPAFSWAWRTIRATKSTWRRATCRAVPVFAALRESGKRRRPRRHL